MREGREIKIKRDIKLKSERKGNRIGAEVGYRDALHLNKEFLHT